MTDDGELRSSVVTTLRVAGCVFAEEEADLLLESAGSVGAGPEWPSTARPRPVDVALLAELVERRRRGVPLEHVLGWAAFCGLRVRVEPQVFVPRRRTEFLVRLGVAALDAVPAGRAVVVDLCCGSGAVGLAVAAAATRAAARGPVELHAADIDPAAVLCARRNLDPLGGRVWQGDLFAALPRELRGRVDLLAVNAPYVPTSAIALMPPEARDHEPLWALDGGSEGVDLQRRIAADAPGWLSPGGVLLIETSSSQAQVTAAAFAAAGLETLVEHDDELEATVVRAVAGQAAG
ncbi:MAG: modification methylase, HemK family [Micrococcaceae bacterium]|nr:modification methylase, HemK family [Micrococcaceae bacterium]